MSCAPSPVPTPRGRVSRAVVRGLLLAPLLLAPLPLESCGGGGGGPRCSPVGHFPEGVLHGPVVGRPTPSGATIGWRTGVATLGSVEWGPDASYGFVLDEPAPARDHALRIEGLPPATTVHYRILLDGLPAGGDHAFRTPPYDPTAPARFAVLGDAGTGCQEEFDAIATITAQSPDFVLHTGDVAYGSGTSGEVKLHFLIPFEDVLDRTPVFPTLGNHDVKTEGGFTLLNALVLPTNPVDGTSRFYSFDWGPCHVACLESNSDLSPTSAQRAWLDADLGATSARWKFVFFHHPVYSSSSHGSTPGLAASLGPVFDAHHVDVVFNGHDHDYERTFPMLADAPTDVVSDPDYANPAGTVHVVTGGGGGSLYPAGTSSFTAFSESVLHVVRVDVTVSTLALTGLRFDGTVLDAMTITKSP